MLQDIFQNRIKSILSDTSFIKLSDEQKQNVLGMIYQNIQKEGMGKAPAISGLEGIKVPEMVTSPAITTDVKHLTDSLYSQKQEDIPADLMREYNDLDLIDYGLKQEEAQKQINEQQFEDFKREHPLSLDRILKLQQSGQSFDVIKRTIDAEERERIVKEEEITAETQRRKEIPQEKEDILKDVKNLLQEIKAPEMTTAPAISTGVDIGQIPEKPPVEMGELFGKGGLIPQFGKRFVGGVTKTGMSILDLLEKLSPTDFSKTRFGVEPPKYDWDSVLEKVEEKIKEFEGEPEGVAGYLGATLGSLSEFITEMMVGGYVLKGLTAPRALRVASKLKGSTKAHQVGRHIINKLINEVPVFTSVEAIRTPGGISERSEGALNGLKMALVFGTISAIPGKTLSTGSLARIPLGNFLLGTSPIETANILKDENIPIEEKLTRLVDTAINMWFSRKGWTKKSLQDLNIAIAKDFEKRGLEVPENIARSMERLSEIEPEKPVVEKKEEKITAEIAEEKLTKEEIEWQKKAEEAREKEKIWSEYAKEEPGKLETALGKEIKEEKPSLKKPIIELKEGVKESLKALKEIAKDPNIGLRIKDVNFESGYEKAKPHFDAAWTHYKAAGKEIAEFVKDMNKELGVKFNPYLERWQKEVSKELPKYARSVNLERQAIPEELKRMELEATEKVGAKKVQSWDKTGEISKAIVADYKKAATIINKAKKGKGVTTVEIDAMRQINVNAIDRLKQLSETLSPKEFDAAFDRYSNEIFRVVSDASSEIGRALNIHKKEVSVNRIGDAFSKLERGLNSRELEEFKKLNLDNPIEVKEFIERLGDPKFRDYFYEYYYNSILSGIPTHLVNTISNTCWINFQIPHRALTAGVDNMISKLTGRQRQVFLSEIVPMMAGYKTGFPKGVSGALEVLRTNKIGKFETKWNREIGNTVIGAFERSPYKPLRIASPLISLPTRALRGMDVWANSIAYDGQMRAIARRSGLQKGLKGKELENFENKILRNPTDEMIKEASNFAKYCTFMDDPGKFTKWILAGRNTIPGSRIIVPFVNTISNLFKRGIEMTPGLGLTLARGKMPADVISKQIEGAILSLYIYSKIQQGEITDRSPEDKLEREAFYRQGKLPWAIKFGDTWYQYRRMEPFNTVIASVAIAYDKIVNSDDEESNTEIFYNMVNGLVDNLLDSSYLQGVTQILDKYQRFKGMEKRQVSALVPFSSFGRSIVRAYEVATEGEAKIYERNKWISAFGQIIPGLNKLATPRLDVWGEDISLPGGILRQWLPYKWSEEKHDPLEDELERLDIYPGMPGRNVKIGGKDIEFDDDFYRDYCVSFGKFAKETLTEFIKSDKYQRQKKDERRIMAFEIEMRSIRNYKLAEAKRKWLELNKNKERLK